MKWNHVWKENAALMLRFMGQTLRYVFELHLNSLEPLYSILLFLEYTHLNTLASGLFNWKASHHFVGFTGNPVGVAHNLQLHISLNQTAAHRNETVRGQSPSLIIILTPVFDVLVN